MLLISQSKPVCSKILSFVQMEDNFISATASLGCTEQEPAAGTSKSSQEPALLQAVPKAWERRDGGTLFAAIVCSTPRWALPGMAVTKDLWCTCTIYPVFPLGYLFRWHLQCPPHCSGPGAFRFPSSTCSSCRRPLSSFLLCKHRFSDKWCNIILFCALAAALAVFSEHNSTNYFT